MCKYVIVTGSSGLIGSESCRFFHSKGFNIIGIDNDMRLSFFGESASTKPQSLKLKKELDNFNLYNIDIRDKKEIDIIFEKFGSNIELVIHTAAQPSHDKAASIPFEDFTINANGTLNILEATRNFCPNAVFIFTSTNKVYGDQPNNLPLIELDKRWEIDPNNIFKNGIDESMSIDQCTHSLFGVSKSSADLMCQEYGRYFGIKTGIFRGGCLTGPSHYGTELHGFLSYLVKCGVNDNPYTIFGDGKQVRDNIHSYDLLTAFYEYYLNPKCGEVYNMGGGRENNVSIFEAIDILNDIRLENGLKPWNNFKIENEKWRIGDHIWYVSNTDKFKCHYPSWSGITISIKDIISEIYDVNKTKL